MDEGKDLCDGDGACGGVLASANGTDYFKPNGPWAYFNTDRTSEVPPRLPLLMSGLDGAGAVHTVLSHSGASLVKNSASLGPYSRTMLRASW